jgi:Cu+-exporting ATPase
VTCPACNAAVDPLRAGYVAILDGSFRYFCDAACKNAYVEAVSKRPALDARTAEPPPVASAARPTSAVDAPTVASGVREHGRAGHAEAVTVDGLERHAGEQVREHGRAGRAEAEVERAALPDGGARALDAPGEQESVPRDAASARAAEQDAGAADEDEEPSPSTLRSPSTEVEAASARKASGAGSKLAAAGRWIRRWLATTAPIAGVCAGVLASVVSLAGEAAGIARLPLALFAAAAALVRLVLLARDRRDPSPWVVGVPIGAASVVSVLSTISRHPNADAHASFCGLGAAAALTVQILLERARRDVDLARRRTMQALAVKARVVRDASRVGRASVSDEARDVDGADQKVGGEPRWPEALEGAVEIVDAAVVKPGEQVLVEAKETIPVDGIVAAGEAEVAPWLDSPALVRKTEGDPVVAGAVVVAGRLRVNATFSGAERAWLRLGHASPSRIEVASPLVAFFRRAVERGASLAALVVAGAVYADNGSWLDVAIAAAGGAYALAAAASVSAAALAHARGHVAAQRRGIVYKDALAFDAAARADVAVVCSRGTILLGEPEIVGVEAITKDGVVAGWLGGAPLNEGDRGSDVARVRAIAAGAEMSSTHPFASAILREARARGVRPDNMRSAISHSGLGVTALAANGDRVIVGSRAFLLQEKVSVAIADARTSELEAEGRSVLLVAVAGRLVGLLALQDGLRPGARAAIQRLLDARIEPVLLSGEARDTCETIARALDIEHVRPEVLPADRGAEVRALADGGRTVAAIGHAATDDGALGAADVAIAMDAAGAAPGEWGVALASDDVRDAALALTLPRAARDRARTAVVVGALGQAASALAIAFGLAPPAIVPVLGVLATVVVLTIVRDPEEAEPNHNLPPRVGTTLQR